MKVGLLGIEKSGKSRDCQLLPGAVFIDVIGVVGQKCTIPTVRPYLLS